MFISLDKNKNDQLEEKDFEGQKMTVTKVDAHQSTSLMAQFLLSGIS